MYNNYVAAMGKYFYAFLYFKKIVPSFYTDGA